MAALFLFTYKCSRIRSLHISDQGYQFWKCLRLFYYNVFVRIDIFENLHSPNGKRIYPSLCMRIKCLDKKQNLEIDLAIWPNFNLYIIVSGHKMRHCLFVISTIFSHFPQDIYNKQICNVSDVKLSYFLDKFRKISPFFSLNVFVKYMLSKPAKD